MRTFSEIREYVNSYPEDKIDDELVYFIESSIIDRKVMIINNVNFDERNRMELPLNASKYLKQIFREIQSLEKAKVIVLEMKKGENDGK